MKRNEFLRLMILWCICTSLSVGVLLGDNQELRFFSFILSPIFVLFGVAFFYKNQTLFTENIIPKEVIDIVSTYAENGNMKSTGEQFNIHQEEVKRTIIKFIKLSL